MPPSSCQWQCSEKDGKSSYMHLSAPDTSALSHRDGHRQLFFCCCCFQHLPWDFLQ